MSEVISPEEHEHLEWETPLYRTALAQYEQALPHAGVEEFVAERLRFPERSLVVSVPVRLDSGRWTVFPGYRVQHSTVLGPTTNSAAAVRSSGGSERRTRAPRLT